MNSLNRIEIFLEVARLQSFSKAAKILGMTGPAVSKQVMTLEDELGVKLLHRTTRLVTLTDEGAQYYERAGVAMEELREAAEQLQDMKATARGSLRISTPVSFGQMHLLPVLAGFARKYPDVQLEVILDERVVDIIAEGYDMAIRIGVQHDSSLVARVLAESPAVLIASPAYIKKNGKPEKPSDLKGHRLVTYSNIMGGTLDWHYKDPAGKTGSLKQEGVFKSNSAEMMVTAVLDGIGIALLPYFSVSTYLASGKLVELLPDYETVPKRYITALMPPNRYRAAKVRLLVDWISQSCKAMPLTRD